jgi:hypothetical protein
MKHTVPSRSARRSHARVFALPSLLFAASIAGLVIGLTGDGVRDITASSLLFLPLLAAAIAWHRRG